MPAALSIRLHQSVTPRAIQVIVTRSRQTIWMTGNGLTILPRSWVVGSGKRMPKIDSLISLHRFSTLPVFRRNGTTARHAGTLDIPKRSPPTPGNGIWIQSSGRLPFSDFVFQRTGPDGIKWMRTSGKPVFDADGTFKGYRGTATDATAEIEAENRASRLSYAIENLEEFFVLWDPSDRLITCQCAIS